jgi:hypothetical protein
MITHLIRRISSIMMFLVNPTLYYNKPYIAINNISDLFPVDCDFDGLFKAILRIKIKS